MRSLARTPRGDVSGAKGRENGARNQPERSGDQDKRPFAIVPWDRFGYQICKENSTEFMTSTSGTHRHSIDLLRFVAAFGIVWAHVLNPNPLAAIGYTSLAIFLMMVPFLSVRFYEERARRAQEGTAPALPRRRYRMSRRMSRLILPWLFWSAFYKVLLTAQAGDPRKLFEVTDPWSLLVGPVVHLWFLPFIFVLSGFVIMSPQVFRSRNSVIIGSALAFIASMAAMWAHDSGKLFTPLGQWAFGIPPFLYGLLLAYGIKFRVIWAPVAFFLGTAIFSVLRGGADYWPWHFVLTAVIFALAWKVEIKSAMFQKLGALAYGIYLIHPFYMMVWYHFVGTDQHQFIGIFVIFVLASITTAIMRKLPYLRAMV